MGGCYFHHSFYRYEYNLRESYFFPPQLTYYLFCICIRMNSWTCISYYGLFCIHMRVLSRSVYLFATPWTVAHQAPLSTGVLQARILEWIVMSSSRGSSQPRDLTQVSCIADGFFTYSTLLSLFILFKLSEICPLRALSSVLSHSPSSFEHFLTF